MSRKEEGRSAADSRNVEVITDYAQFPEGSALYKSGNTWVLCNVSIDNRVKDFLRGQGRGWVTAEYSMLPRSTTKRMFREGWKGKWPRGRSQEIQRLIGRSLRASVFSRRLGERTFIVDCDVIQADGGTRTASVNGGFIALAIALKREIDAGRVEPRPLCCIPAAVSVGIVDGEAVLDMNHAEDQSAQVDMNVVGSHDGRIIEIQGTAEGDPFTQSDFSRMMALALEEINRLCLITRSSLENAGVDVDAMLDR